ncbi:MAG: hypothetical protein QOJ19_1237 [Acidimicrobiia bacterium]|nr:hypothetical protein [Acidimicrobiia bacterium]
MGDTRAEQMTRHFAEFVSADPRELTDAELCRRVLDGEALRRFIDAQHAASLAEFDRRRAWESDGARSAAGWVAARTGRRCSAVQREVRLARALAESPAVAAVAAELSTDHLRMLVSCRSDATLHAYERDEALLIEKAHSLSAEHFSELVQAWRQLADQDGSAEARRDDAQAARVHLSRSLDGWWVLSGLLSPEHGEVLHAALEAGVDRRLRAAHDDEPSVAGRPVSSWRAEALVDLAAQSMRREPSDRSSPDRYRIGLLVSPADLDRAPCTALCDSSVYRVVMGAGSELLDVGRATDIWPTGLRRAITARDGGCIFPGCDRPRRGATSTTASPGPKAAGRASTTGHCCAGCITP